MTKRPTIQHAVLLACAVFALLLITSPVLAQDWAGRGRIQGRVIDGENNPIEGAKVTLYKETPGRGPASLTTDKRGRFGYLGLSGGTWNVVVEKEDWVTSEGSVPVTEFGGGKPLTIELRQIPKEQLVEEAAVEAVRELDRGNALLGEGKFAEARAIYEGALGKLEPAYHHLVKIGIANSYLNEGDAAQAVSTLESMLADHGDDAQLQQALARSYYQNGDVDKSLAMLKTMVESKPDDVASLRLLIDLLVRADREEEAQAYIAKLPEGEKLSADTLLNTGIKLYNNGELDGALEQFDRAVEDNPDVPETYYFRGLTYLGKQLNAEALADFKQFLEIAPDHAQAEEAKQFLEYLESL